MTTARTQQQDDPLPTKPAKRVRFDVSVKDLDDDKSNGNRPLPDQQSIMSLRTVPDMVSYLTKAMSDKLQGMPGPYFKLVEYLAAKPPATFRPEPDRLSAWFRALTQIVSSLTSSYSALVIAVLDADHQCLTTETIALFNAWSTLLENLVSAHAHYIIPVCERLIHAFRKGNRPATRAHTCLKHVLHLIPTGPSVLAPIISKAFPHKAMSVTEHFHYLDGILKMIGYAPVLREHVLALAVDRAIQIDVEIQSGIDELEEEVTINDTVFEALFGPPAPCDGVTHRPSGGLDSNNNTETGGAVSDDEDEDGSDDDDEDEVAGPLVVSIRDTIQKLDAVLHLLFGYIASTTSSSPPASPLSPKYLKYSPKNKSGSSNNVSPLLNLFPSLLDVFERSLLPTHRSRYTQFLWFYACSLDSTLPDAFLACLVQRAFDDSTSPAIRVSASAYIGSFLARASYLSPSLVKTCISLLNEWSVKYAQQADRNTGFVAVASNADESKRHLVFYSAVQSIMYTFCFRWREFMCNEEGDVVHKHRFPPELAGLENVLRNTRLNPLKYCAAPIVNEFATLTSELEISFLFTLLESNRRSQSNSPTVARQDATSPTTSSNADGQAASQPADSDSKVVPSEVLDTFFPFDPFHLPKSKKFVDGIYITWRSRDDEEEESRDESKHHPGRDTNGEVQSGV
ncbi:hypothetical protein SeMB42_g04633 [Synchytrium endobioticum]|uniref:RNA polymerase I-specific transcription initiation factor RRN3 n=1 Tax=Synchytrium endobioticum TaxID=286115 RepID=A0A507D624_9FUNG|nr:hypothetical protein SeMB42_g04633 [Synchytrium endobioticum]TPX46775.1 hypothetical protein SeLEV6574_g03052 [Synchytrium endobioticum]